MNKIEWLNSQVENPTASKEYYFLYDDFKETFDSDLTMESFKRVVRSAFAEINGEDIGSVETEKKHDGSMEVRLKSFDFQTEDDVMEASKLDPEKWEITNFKFRATQNESNPYLVTTASFDKKFRELKYPSIECVKVEIDRSRPVTKELSNAVLNISDFHAPFHDDRCADIFISIAEELQPSHIIYNGDMLDVTDLSRWSADIEHRNRLQESLNAVGKFIAKVREVCPNSKMVYLEGNHEDRLRKVILENVAGAFGLKRVNDLEGWDALSIPNLLCLDDYDVEWVSYKEKGYWITPRLKFHHGEELNVGKMAKERDYCYVIGHGHRVEILSNTKETSGGQIENYTVMSGCTCKVDGSVPAVKSHMNWQQSLLCVWYDEEMSNPVPIYIHEGKALFNGKAYISK